MLTMCDVSVRRGRQLAVDGLTAELPAGAVAAICGPNGSGKSSLLGAIAGTIRHGGAILWRGRVPARGDLAYMPQSGAVRAGLSVLEVVLLGRLDRLGWSLGEADLDAAAAALEAVGLADLAGRRIDTLSGGQQQLVLLAQRLVKRPGLLLLDEPTSALDLSRQLLVLEILAGYARDTGALVVVVLHDLSLAARFASTMLLIREGALAGSGSPAHVLTADTIRETYGIEAEILRSASGAPLIAPLRASEPLSGRPSPVARPAPRR